MDSTTPDQISPAPFLRGKNRWGMRSRSHHDKRNMIAHARGRS